VVSIFAEKMLKNENVSIFGNGVEYRDYIYVEDVVDFVFKIINSKEIGTFNVSSGKITKTIEIFDYISTIIGYKKPPIFLEKRDGDIFGIEIDNSKSKCIGWSPNYNLKAGLKNTVSFLKN
ncbi:MAG: NAD-dependent epimerase/dehydratase family protein, partial [Chloroflexota bacterium]|nr:NAD-dependent epimerase/dehydratase family protein [Chloroflexota bacterium]